MTLDSFVSATAEANRLLSTLKRLLKEQNKTYADVAKLLDLSQASVKRLFSSSGNSFSIERLATICQFLKLNFVELARLMEESEFQAARLSTLTREHEKELVSDTKLLLVAVCALNLWRFEDIIGAFEINAPECVALLLRLERMGLIELLAGNRIRIKVARNFAWIVGGPIEQYFRVNVQDNFLNASFTGQGEIKRFNFAMLSGASMQSLNRSIRHLEAELMGLHQHDRDLPVGVRSGASMLVALRTWEFDSFTALRRKPQETAKDSLPQKKPLGK